MVSVLLWVGAIAFGIIAVVGGTVIGEAGKGDRVDWGMTFFALALALLMANVA